MKFEFPSKFLWGSSISSYQVEGNNLFSDWHVWEKENNLQQAGKATDHYNMYGYDFSIASNLSHNTLRLSIEWARIFPKVDEIDQDALEHYKKVIAELKIKGITPIVCLHHFTNPIWLANERGWLNPESIRYFVKYVTEVVSLLKDDVKYWITFNEPLVYLYNGFIEGIWPPGEKSLNSSFKALRHITRAHILAYKEIKRIYGNQEVKVSIAKHMRYFQPCKNFDLGQNSFVTSIRNQLFNYSILDRLNRAKTLDFIGVNYYCTEYVKASGFLFGQECKDSHHQNKKNYLDWNISVLGFYKMLISLKKYGLPVIVTENGSCEVEDSAYQQFLIDHLKMLAKAINDGVDVFGYLWWSLTDNFEWDKGYNPRFGLAQVDYSTLARNIRPFAFIYKKICQENSIEID